MPVPPYIYIDQRNEELLLEPGEHARMNAEAHARAYARATQRQAGRVAETPLPTTNIEATASPYLTNEAVDRLRDSLVNRITMPTHVSAERALELSLTHRIDQMRNPARAPFSTQYHCMNCGAWMPEGDLRRECSNSIRGVSIPADTRLEPVVEQLSVAQSLRFSRTHRFDSRVYSSSTLGEVSYHCIHCNTWYPYNCNLNCDCLINVGENRATTSGAEKLNKKLMEVSLPSVGLLSMTKQEAKQKVRTLLDMCKNNPSVSQEELQDKIYKLIDLVESDPKPMPEVHVEVHKLNAQDIISKLFVPVSIAEWAKDIPKNLVSKLSFFDLQRLKDSFIKSQKRLSQ